MRSIISIFIWLSISLEVASQIRFTDHRDIDERLRYSAEKDFRSWALSVGYGPILMFGDIVDNSNFPATNWKFGTTVTLSKQFAPPIALDLQFITGQLYGERGLFFFEGDFHDISLGLVAYINQLGARPGPVNDVWNFYLKAGAGAKFFRSSLKYLETGEVVPVADFGIASRSYMVTGYDRRNPQNEIRRQMEIMVPLGFGVLYQLNNHIDLGFEATMRFCASDNLDNILTGPTNDRYLFASVNLSYKIGRSDVPHKRWTYRGLGMNLFGRPRQDMVRDELRNVENQIANLRELPPIGKDSVVIQHILTTTYETLHLKSLFFGEDRQTTFNAEEQMAMAEMVVLMKHYPDRYLHLYGYADPGETGNHIDLSRARAESVKDFLVNELGADAGMINIIPVGSADAFTGNELSTPRVTRLANRRVDMVFRN